MKEREIKHILSIEGVYNSIINDQYTFRWFLYFIKNRKKIDKKKADVLASSVWMKYNKANMLQIFCFLIALLSAVISIHFGRWEILPLTIIFFYLSYLNRARKRKCVAQISCDLVKADYSDEALSRMTLYQLCEEYSEKYKIISLVDAIYHLDKIYRFVLIFSVVLIFYITSIKTWWIRYSMVIIVYFIAKFIANSSLFYKHYK